MSGTLYQSADANKHPAHLSACGLTATENEDDSSVQAKQGWKHSLDLALCCVQKTQEPIRSVGQRSWQNRTAVICSIQFVQQHSVQSTRAFAQGIPKTCCLDNLASARGKPCAVSKPLFAMLSLVLAQHYSLLTTSNYLARVRPLTLT